MDQERTSGSNDLKDPSLDQDIQDRRHDEVKTSTTITTPVQEHEEPNKTRLLSHRTKTFS